jgi:hypothetical protein
VICCVFLLNEGEGNVYAPMERGGMGIEAGRTSMVMVVALAWSGCVL